jgi:hypothetical protein
MTTDQKSYADSYKYEIFMRRAHRSDRNFSKGIDNSVFLLLNHIDRGHYGKPKDHPKQVLKIKNLLLKAIEKVLKWKLSPEELRSVKFYEGRVQAAYDEAALAYAIEGLLNTTQRFIG